MRPTTGATSVIGMERIDRRPVRADETTTLRGFLDHHRDTFRWKCSGLTQEQLARPLPPSDMTLGGMMKHLADRRAELVRGRLRRAAA